MHAHPTDRALPPFYIGTEIPKPTMITVHSTIHFVIPHDAACLSMVMAITEASASSRSYMLVSIDESSETTLAVQWHSEHKDADGHRHVLKVVVANDDVRCEQGGYSESSLGGSAEHVLARCELARFGLCTGSLAFAGTRTVQVWLAHPKTCQTVVPVTLVFEEIGLHFYLRRHSLQDDIPGMFLELDGDASVA